MDYFLGVVTEYLRASRSVFINTELLIQLDLGDLPTQGLHRFCDVAAADFRANTFYLCEVTYSKSMSALATRLISWSTHWPEIRQALFRDCGVPATWQIKPRAFIPLEYHETLKKRLAAISHRDDDEHAMPPPLITYLESIVPWRDKSWTESLKHLNKRPKHTSEVCPSGILSPARAFFAAPRAVIQIVASQADSRRAESTGV